MGAGGALLGRELWQEIVEVLDFCIEVEIEREIGAADRFEVVDLCEDVDCSGVSPIWRQTSSDATDQVDMAGVACLEHTAVSC